MHYCYIVGLIGQATPPAGQGGLLCVIMPLVFLVVYLIPTVIALKRGHPNRVPIILINILAGWMYGIGWLVALVWSCIAIDRSKQYR